MKKFLSLCLCLALALSVGAISVFAEGSSESTAPSKPFNIKVHAKNAIMYNVDTDTVVYDLNADKRVFPASLTKIMVAVLFVEKFPDLQNETFKISKEVHEKYLYSEAVTIGFNEGDSVNGKDLLAYTLIKSGADAAEAIAEEVAGSEDAFIALMNAKAKEIGMTGTHFVNCHGLHDTDHYSTARDMCILTKYAMQYSIITEIVDSYIYETVDGDTVVTTNFMINPNYITESGESYFYEYATGFKTGFTDQAGRCLASTATFEGMTYILILLGCPAEENSTEDRFEFIDSKALYEWAFSSLSYRCILKKNDPLQSIPVNYSWDYDEVQVLAQSELFALLPKDADDTTIDIKIEYDKDYEKNGIDAPIKKGDAIGKINIYYAEKLIGSTKAIAGSSIEGSQLLVVSDGVETFLDKYIKYIIGAVLVFVILVIFFIILIIRLNSKKKKYGRVRNYKRF